MSEPKKISRRKWLKAAGGVVVAAAAVGAGADYFLSQHPSTPTNATLAQTSMTSMSAASTGTLAIGSPFPMTGPYAVYGDAMRMGVLFAANQLNAKGGILGRPLDIEIRDDEADPTVATTKIKALVEDNNIQAIDGVLSSAVNWVINDLVKQPGFQIPFMCANMTEITMHAANVLAPMTAFPMTVDIASALALIGAANKLWPNFTAYTLDADYVWGHELRQTCLGAMSTLGGTEVGHSEFPVGTTDFSTLLTTAESSKADVLLAIAGGADQVNMAKQAIQFGTNKTMNIIFPLTLQTVAFQAGGVATYEGIYCGTDYVWEVQDAGYPYSDAAKTFNDTWTETFGTPAVDPYSLGTYVGLMEYAAACERAGTTDPNAVIAELANHQFSYVKGPEYWRPCDRQAIQDWYIVEGKTPDESTAPYDIFKVVSKAGTDNPDFYFQTPASLGYTTTSSSTTT